MLKFTLSCLELSKRNEYYLSVFVQEFMQFGVILSSSTELELNVGEFAVDAQSFLFFSNFDVTE